MTADPQQSSPYLPPTERRNPRSTELDELSTVEVLRLLNQEDRAAVDAVSEVLEELAPLVERAADRLREGGTVHYFGAGTSGRLGVLDASELRPTFNLEPGRVVGHIAGGQRALVEAVENAEDSEQEGREAAADLGPADIAIGVAASGSTPFVGGALQAAGRAGVHTVLISNNPKAPLAQHAAEHLILDTGPEVVTGSTRMKAGTSQKLVLNSFSTALMIAIGRTWQNLMVSVVATNAKLRERTVRILREAVELEDPAARELLEQTGGDLKAAIVSSLGEVSPARAAELLEAQDGSVRDAIAAVHGASRGDLA
ncbi:N-acetylmuramic acid 6-phosphate etherase [Nesterenkonia cremea]|uniref:N-acetylmuramic acid 6-phosphate etherase n=1 Tax=Nesterenkonia cremea TaxID=1882340 RepID=A0A917EMX3_9MICC|nr:N-acetylmuramic acid 6-phosphate etherase [Nesterenkonia cremea]GGE58537.1 N-acetylmuramic acid 6-phosphate etherase [Nesterenkonia cremea]